MCGCVWLMVAHLRLLHQEAALVSWCQHAGALLAQRRPHGCLGGIQHPPLHAQGGPSVLFVPDKPEGEQNWAWGSGTDHKKEEVEEETWDERQANREAATEKAEESGGAALPGRVRAETALLCLIGIASRPPMGRMSQGRVC